MSERKADRIGRIEDHRVTTGRDGDAATIGGDRPDERIRGNRPRRLKSMRRGDPPHHADADKGNGRQDVVGDPRAAHALISHRQGGHH